MDRLISHEYLNEIVNSLDVNQSIQTSQDTPQPVSLESQKVLKTRYEVAENVNEFEPEDVQELYLSALTQSFDPHTTFMNIKEKEKFDQAMNNEFVGIGAVLTDVDGYCTIKELLPGGPAEACQGLNQKM